MTAKRDAGVFYKLAESGQHVYKQARITVLSMEEGLIRFLRKWYYFVAVGIAFVATMFAVMYPAMALFMIIIVLAVVGFVLYYYYKYEILKKERHPLPKAPRPTHMVEEVSAEVSNMPDLGEMARIAAQEPRHVKAHMMEGSGMDMVERYFPLGEVLFPISFIADRASKTYQEGSLEVGEPLCLWHTIPVWFSAGPPSEGARYSIHCSKCPNGGRTVRKSLDEMKQMVEYVATATLRSGEMPMQDETLLNAVKRGRGELPG